MSPLDREPAGIVRTRRSKHTLLHDVPVGEVTLGEGFWRPRVASILERSLPHQHAKLIDEGVIANFLRVAGKSDGEDKGYVFRDSDLYKWIEAASFALQVAPDEALERQVEEAISIVADAQTPEGYVNTYYQARPERERFSNLEHDHELYCLGHLCQAAVAWRRATGKTDLLALACRAMDYVDSVFGPGKRAGHCGHPEVEMGLIELYRETGEERYLALARFFVDDQKGTEFEEIAGHAVRALYFLCGMADLALETGAEDARGACERLWRSMVETRMYVTGAVGGRVVSESFGRAFELPQEASYAETCANIANAMFNWRMLLLTGETRFADLMELALYNSVLSGISLDGTRFFYVNPHASSGKPYHDPWYPWQCEPQAPQRVEWYGCACCPPNVARTIASVGGLFYSTDADGVWVHLYDEGEWEGKLEDETPIRITQRTHYPWDGRVEITVECPEETRFSLRLRVPGWARDATLTLNDETPSRAPEGLYHSLNRYWSPGDRVTLDLPMEPTLYSGNPRSPEHRASTALRRGPLVYCLEQVDNPEVDVLDVRVDPSSAGFHVSTERYVLDEVTVLDGTGFVPEGEWGELFRPIAFDARPLREVPLRAVPYFVWCNREPGAMALWMLRLR